MPSRQIALCVTRSSFRLNPCSSPSPSLSSPSPPRAHPLPAAPAPPLRGMKSPLTDLALGTRPGVGAAAGAGGDAARGAVRDERGGGGRGGGVAPEGVEVRREAALKLDAAGDKVEETEGRCGGGGEEAGEVAVEREGAGGSGRGRGTATTRLTVVMTGLVRGRGDDAVPGGGRGCGGGERAWSVLRSRAREEGGGAGGEKLAGRLVEALLLAPDDDGAGGESATRLCRCSVAPAPSSPAHGPAPRFSGRASSGPALPVLASDDADSMYGRSDGASAEEVEACAAAEGALVCAGSASGKPARRSRLGWGGRGGKPARGGGGRAGREPARAGGTASGTGLCGGRGCAGAAGLRRLGA